MKKRVFITGATGNMGGAAFQELLRRSDRFDIVLLARHSKKNIAKLKEAGEVERLGSDKTGSWGKIAGSIPFPLSSMTIINREQS